MKMNSKELLISEIGLGFAPMSAYHFRKLIMDKEFQDNVLDSDLYIIAQRKALTFHNFNFEEELKLSFEIEQDENPLIIKFTLPIAQENITTDLSKQIGLRLHNRRNTVGKKSKYPYDGTEGFTIKETEFYGKEIKTSAWFSLDKLFHDYVER